MRIKSEKGAVGTDIAIAVIVIFLFVSIIATLLYQFQSGNREITLKSQALDIAVEEIERIKNEGFEKYKTMNSESGPIIDNKDLGQEESKNEGFYETVLVQDYTELVEGEDKIPNLVKKITVTIKYTFKGQTEEISLNTVLSKKR